MDAAGFAGVLLVLIAGHLVLIRSPLRDLQASRQLETDQQATTQTLSQLQKDYLARTAQLKDTRKTLEKRAIWAADANWSDEILSKVTDLARQCDVCVTRWQPQGQQVFVDYRAQTFSVNGSASWPALLRWLALLEEGVPLFDTTHFSINAPKKPGEPCEFSCSLKLYLGTPSEPVEMAVAR